MLRSLVWSVVRHGRQVLQEAIPRKPSHAIKIKIQNKDVSRPDHFKNTRTENLELHRYSRKWAHILTGFGRKTMAAQARKEIANNLQNSGMGRAGNVLFRAWERASGKRLLSLYAFVGLSLHAGSREVEVSDKQLDLICEEIKKIVIHKTKHSEVTPPNVLSLSDLDVGTMIAKGCNAAVYEARITAQPELNGDVLEDSSEYGDDDSDITFLNESENEFELSQEDYEFLQMPDDESSNSDFIVLNNINKIASDSNGEELATKKDETMNLALKVMFNYEAESNADAIYRVMQNEMLPTELHSSDINNESWCNVNLSKKKRLKNHPNIVQMWGAFVDTMPALPEAWKHYPDALPSTINPDGFGRSKTMFLVMNRYEMTLREYLRGHSLDLQTSMLLFSQLLEAVVHLTEEQVAHRDLKSDNILLTETEEGLLHLVVTDFGCGLADEQNGLVVPYLTEYMFKGGNSTLMAPEIACAEPGFGQFLDYRKSDLWAAGAIAFEIFGAENPFYRNVLRHKLDSRTYRDEDLPNMPDAVPSEIKALVKAILHKNPDQRPTARTAANIMFLYQALSQDLINGNTQASKLGIARWLLNTTAGLVCEKSSINLNFGISQVYLNIKQCFLERINLDEIVNCIRILSSNVIN